MDWFSDSKKKKSGKKSIKLVPDPDYLNFSYYRMMVAGFALLPNIKVLTGKKRLFGISQFYKNMVYAHE